MINWKVRFKNPYFWVGIIGVILTAAHISPEVLTSWPLLAGAFIGIVNNPFVLGSVLLAVLGVVLDPTTAGIKDSANALTYNTPKEGDRDAVQQ